MLKEDPESQAIGLDQRAEAAGLVLITMLHGTASMARAGKTAQELSPIIENALDGLGL